MKNSEILNRAFESKKAARRILQNVTPDLSATLFDHYKEPRLCVHGLGKEAVFTIIGTTAFFTEAQGFDYMDVERIRQDVQDFLEAEQ